MKKGNDWTHVDIGAHLKLLSGFPFPSGKFSTEEGFPLIRIRDVVDSKIETYYRGVVLTPYVVKKGDILVGMDGDFNISKWRNKDALLNQRVLKVDVNDPSKLDGDLIYYWLQPYVRKVNEITAATTVKHLSTKDLVKAKGRLPNIKAQQKIARILQTIDQTIEKTEALIDKYQQIKAGLMHDLFTRGIGPDGQLRPSREQAPELYQETPIGWIPKEWEPLKLKEILHRSGGYLQTGPFGSQLHSHEYTDEGIPVVMPQDINSGGIDEMQIARITEIRAQSLAKHRLKIGDIIIARRGELSRAAAIGEIEQGWVCGTGCFLLRLGGSNLDTRFFSMAYRNVMVQRQVDGLAVGSTMPSLNNAIMEKLVFPYLRVEEQSAIADKVQLTDDRKKSLQAELEKLRKQKSGLMYDLLTGKVEVKAN
jgi:type I restriction enzyme S subunit